MNKDELRVVEALLSTFFPSCSNDKLAPNEPSTSPQEADNRPNSSNPTNRIDGDFYALSGDSFQGLAAKILEAIDTRLNYDLSNQLHLVFRLLSTRFGTLILCGRHSLNPLLPSAFSDLPLANRERVLQSWASSRLPQLRQAFKGIKCLLLSALLTWLELPRLANKDGKDASGSTTTKVGISPILEAMRYPITDPQRPEHPRSEALKAESAISAALIDLQNISCGDGGGGGGGGGGDNDDEEHAACVKEAAARLTAKGLKVITTDKKSSSVVETGLIASEIWDEKPDIVVLCDAIVVGSGAGGGVAAARLAASGLKKVVVLEKGGFVPAAEMSGSESEAFGAMVEAGGLLQTEDGGMTVLAGATLGGGTRVNWSASFRTPDHVCQEWSSSKHGLLAFTTPEYQHAMDAVCQRLSVRAGHFFRHGPACSALALGLQEAGFDCGEVPRNCVDDQCSGYCTFGCARGAKQDAVNTFLADACSRRGRSGKIGDGGSGGGCGMTRIVTGVWAEKIITKNKTKDEQKQQRSDTDAAASRKKKVAGVLATVNATVATDSGSSTTCHKIKIAFVAPSVISAAGAIHTPALLLRSGIQCLGNVGQNLRLHPCTVVVGTFPEDTCIAEYCREQESEVTYKGDSKLLGCIRSWQGPTMSVYSRQVANWPSDATNDSKNNGSGYGAVLYNPACHPGLFAAAAPWLNGKDFKDILLKYRNAVAVLVLVRDQGAGRVTIDSAGQPRLRYAVGAADGQSMMDGMLAGLKALEASGAESVMTLINSQEGRCDLPEATNNKSSTTAATTTTGSTRAEVLDNFLNQVRATGIPSVRMPTFSAHQMGTACMGKDPSTSVVDCNGECWEVEGIFVCDGSVLPTSVGVNPMITIESVSYMIADRIASRKIGGGGGDGKRLGQLQYEG